MSEPRERPVLFSGPMVKAILEGRKTQTRRVVRPQPENPNVSGISPVWGQGDRLWVRETWKALDYCDHLQPCHVPQHRLAYLADSELPKEVPWPHHWGKTRPGIFMPRWASRITLEICSVHVERLDQITEQDAIAEGIFDGAYDPGLADGGKPGWCYGLNLYAGTPRHAYELLWDSINAKRGFGWDTNPWVWRISFRRVD